MNDALKRLRIKFVAIIMAVVATILAVVFAVILVVDHNNNVDEVYQALDEVIAHDVIDQEGKPRDANPLSNEAPDQDVPPFEIGGRNPDRSLIPVAVYEITPEGNLTLVSNAASGMMKESILENAAEQAQTLSDGHGFLNSLGVYYLKSTKGEKELIAFADEQSVSGWKSLAPLLGGVGFGALVLFFIVSLIFSKWALRPVETSWHQQQQFVADASHELKTPLTVMAADVAILKRHPDRTIASQSQWIESIEAENKGMQELVNDMLLLANTDTQEYASTQQMEQVDLSKLLNANILQFEPLAYERNISFFAAIAENVVIIGNCDKLQRLINVLVDNAFKYVAKEGSISLNLTIQKNSALLSVSNSGAPIPDEDIPFIFDRFYRSDKARTHNEKHGYGLGLSIAREIAQMHGGTIDVVSEDALTSFIVNLPLAHSNPPTTDPENNSI